jgi:alginate O-acetyltransferase complex protein AlgI
MLFNSPVYIFLFLPLVLVIYFLLNRLRLIGAGKVWLVTASLFFYGYWEPRYLVLIIVSILVNFVIGTALHRSKMVMISASGASRSRRRMLKLLLGIAFNLVLLGYFKYADFLIFNYNWITGDDAGLMNLVLPLAISFFTFQQIAYLVDCYKEDTQEYNFLNYCLFVTFFPQLIAGPIVHHREMMPQFTGVRNKVVKWDNITRGSFIFSLGLFKKTVIADSFSVCANAGFDTNTVLTFYEAWATSLSYTFQLYYDFSGYSDMAIGAALMFNIRLPVNFNSPYKAVNIQDFWRRWHITLSRWLRDYIYIPLGGNRHSKPRVLVNLMLTFLIGGLWHGAAWTFVVWGAMHGGALVLHRTWQSAGLRVPVFIGWLLTFLFVNATWVFFRAESFADALRVLRGMAGLNGVVIGDKFARTINHLQPVEFPTFLVIFALVAFCAPNSLQYTQFLPYKGVATFSANTRNAVFLALVFFLSILTFVGDVVPSEFLYFNF